MPFSELMRAELENLINKKLKPELQQQEKDSGSPAGSARIALDVTDTVPLVPGRVFGQQPAGYLRLHFHQDPKAYKGEFLRRVIEDVKHFAPNHAQTVEPDKEPQKMMIPKIDGVSIEHVESKNGWARVALPSSTYHEQLWIETSRLYELALKLGATRQDVDDIVNVRQPQKAMTDVNLETLPDGNIVLRFTDPGQQGFAQAIGGLEALARLGKSLILTKALPNILIKNDEAGNMYFDLPLSMDKKHVPAQLADQYEQIIDAAMVAKPLGDKKMI